MVLLGGKLSKGLKETWPSTSLEHKWFVKKLLITFRCELFVSTRVLYIKKHIYLLYKKQMCIKEIEGFKVSKMHWVLYSSENPDTFSFPHLWKSCRVMACHLLQETCHDMSLVFTCSRYILKNSGIGWYGNVWKTPPSFFGGRGQLNAWIVCIL